MSTQIKTKQIKTVPFQGRLPADKKVRAERILEALGITPTQALTMYYEAIIRDEGIPFSLKLSKNTKLSDEEIQEINKGLEDYKADRYTRVDTSKPNAIKNLLNSLNND